LYQIIGTGAAAPMPAGIPVTRKKLVKPQLQLRLF